MPSSECCPPETLVGVPLRLPALIPVRWWDANTTKQWYGPIAKALSPCNGVSSLFLEALKLFCACVGKQEEELNKCALIKCPSEYCREGTEERLFSQAPVKGARVIFWRMWALDRGLEVQETNLHRLGRKGTDTTCRGTTLVKCEVEKEPLACGEKWRIPKCPFCLGYFTDFSHSTWGNYLSCVFEKNWKCTPSNILFPTYFYSTNFDQ